MSEEFGCMWEMKSRYGCILFNKGRRQKGEIKEVLSDIC